MIEATIVESTDAQVSKYPRLMESCGDSWDSGEKIIVEFTDYGVGRVVASNVGERPYGSTDDNWSMGCFTDFHGSVTLRNKK